MEGGVMTTGLMQFVHGGEPLRMTLRDIHQSLRCGREIARLMPGVADRPQRAMIATGTLGAASPPISR